MPNSRHMLHDQRKGKFYEAINKLEKTLNKNKHNESNDALKPLDSLIKKAKKIVRKIHINDTEQRYRITELTRIINWADDALNGKFADSSTANYPASLLYSEREKASDSDMKSTDRLCHGLFFLCSGALTITIGLAVTAATGAAIGLPLTLGLGFAIIGLLMLTVNSLVDSLVDSNNVGHEVKELEEANSPSFFKPHSDNVDHEEQKLGEATSSGFFSHHGSKTRTTQTAAEYSDSDLNQNLSQASV